MHDMHTGPLNAKRPPMGGAGRIWTGSLLAALLPCVIARLVKAVATEDDAGNDPRLDTPS